MRISDWSSDVCSSDLGEEWDAQLSSPESLAGLAQVQQLMTEASVAPKDGDNAEPWTPYCEGAAIQFSAPNWALGLASECETDNPPAAPFVYPLPGINGGVDKAFAGGSTRQEARRVGKGCVRTCRLRGAPE